jgi:hypothetical protein
MKGYVYITSNGTDPGLYGNLNDPIFGKTPTLGACMPNIRRLVVKGDYIFTVSGKSPGVQQYVVGGLSVVEKISALAAYERFPQNRLRIGPTGQLEGNVIVDATGKQHKLDTHAADTFEDRIKDFIVGSGTVALTKPAEVELGRQQTLGKLAEILKRPRGNRVIDVLSRWSKLDEKQVMEMLDWLKGIKASV